MVTKQPKNWKKTFPIYTTSALVELPILPTRAKWQTHTYTHTNIQQDQRKASQEGSSTGGVNTFCNLEFFSVFYWLLRTDPYSALLYLGGVFWIGLRLNLHSDCVCACVCGGVVWKWGQWVFISLFTVQSIQYHLQTMHTDTQTHRDTHTHTDTQSYLGDWEIKNDSSKDNFFG